MDMRLPEDLKILLVEDNQINQRIAALLFKKSGLKYDVAFDGMDAFDKYRQRSYDLILMDVQMPVMDGLECTRLIREFERGSDLHHRAFIVALTGSETSDKKDICMEAGMDEFIEKPIRAEWLHKLVSLRLSDF